MNRTPIEWTDFSANPLKFRAPAGRVVWACEKLSPGCQHCYAEDLSHRYGGVRRAGDWNANTMATLTPFLDEAELHKMRTAKVIGGKAVAGSRCFIGDMTDIFGEWVSDDLLNRLFSQTLEIRTDVTWQLLTKRAERMHRYLSWRWGGGRIPSRHIHIGVSVENQKYADERIPLLLQTPAAVRFISAEPLLGPVSLDDEERSYFGEFDHRPTYDYYRTFLRSQGIETDGKSVRMTAGLDWVIVGGESGTGARPFDVAWARSIVQQCQAAGVAVFVKQLGSVPVMDEAEWRAAPLTRILSPTNHRRAPEGTVPIACADRKGGTPEEWPADLRVRQFPEARV